MKALLIAATAAVLGSTGAQAADIAARPYVKAPPVVSSTYSWSGFYIGANAGYAWGDFDRTGVSDPVGFTVSAPGLNAYNSRTFRDSKFTGGGQVGFNVQSGNWVAGVEADFSWAGLKHSVINQQISIGGPNFADGTSSLDWFVTLRGRVGFAFDRFFVYGTGGVAWADVASSGAYRYLGGPQSGLVSRTVTGWTLGAGVEYALTNNWTMKAEYLYLDLGDVSFDTGNINPPLLLNTNTSITQKNTLQVVRAGINYKFDWLSGPVVAKY